MELRQLRYFVAVAEVENVSLAARRLNVSQPPLSRQIHQLEEELGCALFERAPKSLRLTRAGEVFAREAREVLERVDQASAAARAAATESTELRVGYAPSLTVKILPRALRSLRDHAPGIKVRLNDMTTAEMLRAVRAKELDLALVVHPGKAALRGLLFHELDLVPACAVLPHSHPLAKRTTIPVDALAREPVIAFSRTDYPEYHRWLASVFKVARARPRIVEEHDSITSLIAAVESGCGIAFGGDGFRELCGGRLRVRNLAKPAPPIQVGAVCATGATHSGAQWFLETGRKNHADKL